MSHFTDLLFPTINHNSRRLREEHPAVIFRFCLVSADKEPTALASSTHVWRNVKRYLARLVAVLFRVFMRGHSGSTSRGPDNAVGAARPISHLVAGNRTIGYHSAVRTQKLIGGAGVALAKAQSDKGAAPRRGRGAGSCGLWGPGGGERGRKVHDS